MNIEELGSNLAIPPARKPRAAKPPEEAKPSQAVGMPERKKIILEENENIPPNGLYIGLNGVGYILKPGEVANAPIGVIDILEHAIEMTPVLDATTRRVVGHRQKQRFPFRFAA